ncbi:MAG: type II secretion system F family protein [Planctomycetaceae bacterium]
MQFTYQARDTSGRIREGDLNASSADEASRLLRQEGLYLLRIDEATRASHIQPPTLFRRRVNRNEIIYLTSQLAVLVDAGVPLSESLEGLAKQNENPTLRTILTQIQKQVESGDDLSTALKRHPRHFDSTYVNLIKASEASGTLAQMLDRIATQSRSELETRQKVQGALLYPGVMLLMCIGVSIFLLIYVFPKLLPMFETKQIQIPLPTRVMMTVSNTLIHHWYWVLAVCFLVIAGGVYLRKQAWGRLSLDWLWLHSPILGPMLKKVILGRNLKTLAITINAGVPVLQALELTAAVSNNRLYERSWTEIAQLVTTGKQIHEALSGNDLFPATVKQMISSGEATGKLGMILEKVSQYYERETSNAIKSATTLIEPLMVFLMGGVIGTIALAMLLPIFKLSSAAH